MFCIFLILIKVQKVLVEEGSQEIKPFQVHSWLRVGDYASGFVFFFQEGGWGGRPLFYLRVYLSESGLRNALHPHSDL